MPRRPPVMVRGEAVRDELDRRRRRAKPGHVARRDLERYYMLLRRVQPKVTGPEARAILAALRHTGFVDIDDAPFRVVDEIVDHAHLMEDLPDRGEALIDRLRAFGPAEQLALTDAIERCRILMRAGHTVDHALYEAGLVVEDEGVVEEARSAAQ